MDAEVQGRLLSAKTLDELYRMCMQEGLLREERTWPKHDLNSQTYRVVGNIGDREFSSETGMQDWDNAINFALSSVEVVKEITDAIETAPANSRMQRHVLSLWDDTIRHAQGLNDDREERSGYGLIRDYLALARDDWSWAVRDVFDALDATWQKRVEQSRSQGADRSRG